MQEQEIITFLSLVGDELQDVGLTQPIRILLIGGAYMLTQIHNRATTQDIDVIVLAPAADSQEYTIFKQIVRFVAQDQGINPAWLSDNIAEFLQSTGNIPQGKLWFQRGNLEVYIPDPGYIFASKFLANRAKDQADILALLQTLAIHNRRQANTLLKKYIKRETLKDYKEDIEESLDFYFD